MTTLKAEKRDMSVKAKKLRREGFVTGNVFGKDMEGSMPIQIQEKDAERFFRTNGKGSRVMLEVDGQTIAALVKEIDYNFMKRQILEMDFQVLVKGEKVHSVAEVVFVNQDMVQAGILEKLLNEISYRALPESLVEKVEIDVSSMKIGDSIKVADLPIASDPGVELLTDPESAVAAVIAPHNNVEEESEEAAEEPAE